MSCNNCGKNTKAVSSVPVFNGAGTPYDDKIETLRAIYQTRREESIRAADRLLDAEKRLLDAEKRLLDAEKMLVAALEEKENFLLSNTGGQETKLPNGKKEKKEEEPKKDTRMDYLVPPSTGSQPTKEADDSELFDNMEEISKACDVTQSEKTAASASEASIKSSGTIMTARAADGLETILINGVRVFRELITDDGSSSEVVFVLNNPHLGMLVFASADVGSVNDSGKKTDRLVFGRNKLVIHKSFNVASKTKNIHLIVFSKKFEDIDGPLQAAYPDDSWEKEEQYLKIRRMARLVQTTLDDTEEMLTVTNHSSQLILYLYPTKILALRDPLVVAPKERKSINQKAIPVGSNVAKAVYKQEEQQPMAYDIQWLSN